VHLFPLEACQPPLFASRADGNPPPQFLLRRGLATRVSLLKVCALPRIAIKDYTAIPFGQYLFVPEGCFINEVQ
jgi:hypothetical protein